jgi:hypothetical protein
MSATYESVSALLTEARSHAEVIAAAQAIEHVAEAWNRERLAKVVKQKLDEFKKH